MNVDNSWFDTAFADSPYMGIFRGQDLDQTLRLARLAWDQGIELVEIPVQHAGDIERLTRTAAAAAEVGKVVGAGTVRSIDQVELVKRAGARFIACPGFNSDVVASAAALGMPALPGVATASEVDSALTLGLTWLKAFPAITLGSNWITQMAGPFPQAKFVATGGMTLGNAAEFFKAGARGVAIGSAIEQLANHGAL
jgi:2-dehydro-3-deoxyphosphogluconate aldolase / (4S)-4-hydroxy-2-oxoglutarate aldolase